MIKRGDPNTGEFYYPNPNGKLTLQEAPLTVRPCSHWTPRCANAVPCLCVELWS